MKEDKTKGVFIGGVIEGQNYPKGKTFLDATGYHDLIIVDRKYLVDNVGVVLAWAKTKREEK
jgi:hypothetical protein